MKKQIVAVHRGEKFGEDLQVFINWREGSLYSAHHPDVLVISLRDFGRVVFNAKMFGHWDVHKLMEHVKVLLDEAYFSESAFLKSPRLSLRQ